MAEELAFEHLARNRAAVDPYEWPPRPSSTLVDLFGEQLLTSAGLSGDQHRRIRRRHVVDLLQDVTERTASADDAAEVQDAVDFFLQIGVVRFELLPQPVEL